MIRKIINIMEMTKPTQLLLLSVTMYGAYFAAGGAFDPRTIFLLALAGLGSAGGVTALNMYIERDIDKLMHRTMKRPLPSKRLSEREALAGIVFLIVIGTVAASFINKWVLLTTLIGLYFDIIAYTEVSKRNTEWSLLFGSVAGSMPALGGWAAATGSIGLPGVLLAGMVYVWQPLHVAFIHFYYSKDYEKAGLPTIPGNLGHKTFAKLATVSVIALVTLNLVYVFIEGYGIVSLIVVSCLAYRALKRISVFTRNPLPENARNMIKYASPMLGVVFLLLPIEYVFMSQFHLAVG